MPIYQPFSTPTNLFRKPFKPRLQLDVPSLPRPFPHPGLTADPH